VHPFREINPTPVFATDVWSQPTLKDKLLDPPFPHGLIGQRALIPDDILFPTFSSLRIMSSHRNQLSVAFFPLLRFTPGQREDGFYGCPEFAVRFLDGQKGGEGVL